MKYLLLFSVMMSVACGQLCAVTSKKAMRDFQKAVNGYTPGDAESVQNVKEAYKVVYMTFPQKSFPVLNTRFTRQARKMLLDAGVTERDYKEIISMKKSKPTDNKQTQKKQAAVIVAHKKQQEQEQHAEEAAALIEQQEYMQEQPTVEQPLEAKLEELEIAGQPKMLAFGEKLMPVEKKQPLPKMGLFVRMGKNGLYLDVDSLNKEEQAMLKNIGRI